MRAVVTGMGAVTGLGIGLEALRRGLREGATGVRQNTLFDELDQRRSFASFVESAPAALLARAEHFLELAVLEATDHAGLDLRLEQAAIFLGTAQGNVDAWSTARRQETAVSLDQWTLGHALWPRVARQRTVDLFTTACTSSAIAVGQCLDCLRAGQGDLAIVAASEGFTPFMLEGFKALHALANGNCRPFDRQRTGFVLGEGAAALVVESLDHARARGATPLAEISGFGQAADGMHFTAADPAGRGLAAAIRECLRDAGMTDPPASINAHGSGTKINDRAECVALQRVFGGDVSRIPVTSTKPITGHMCGAAGAIETICAILGLREDFVAPITTFREADCEFGRFDFVHSTPRPLRQHAVLSLNSAFGGTNTAIALRQAPS